MVGGSNSSAGENVSYLIAADLFTRLHYTNRTARVGFVSSKRPDAEWILDDACQSAVYGSSCLMSMQIPYFESSCSPIFLISPIPLF